MHITSTNYTVADYCQAMERKEIVVNRDYQRSARVWPPISRSFLIETILLTYPIPKLSLFQVTDIKSRKTYKEIVDGQQRSRAVLDFYNDRFRLSRSSEIGEVAGKLYSELDEEYQHRFLDYSLSADLFVSATPAEIREVFRRINSYTVPLNPEEKRHSIYQGEFKWFIYELSKTYDQNFIDIGLFGQKQLIRMADAKLFTEIIHAFLHGITKTDARKLDNLYKSHERDFSKKAELEKRIDRAINFVLSLEEIHQSPLVKPYNFYSLILAVSHIMNPVDGFKSIYEPPIPNLLDRNFVLSNFTKLAEALENPDAFGDKAFKEFVLATLSDTNGQQNRQTRFKWFCKALEPKLL